MLGSKVKYLIVILISSCIAFNLYSQNSSPYYFIESYNKYLNYLLIKGEIKPDHILSQPFNSEELLKAISKNSDSNNYFTKLIITDFQRFSHASENSAYLLTGIESGGQVKLNQNTLSKRLSGDGFFGLNYKNFGFFHRITADEAYLSDSLYFGTEGKLQNSNFGRTSESYLQLSLNPVKFFIGRMNRNYGLPGESSLILSDNAYSFDHIGFEINHKRFHFVSLFSRLEDFYGYDIREDSIPKFDWYKRFLSFHRLEISILDNLEIALTETMLHGGKTQQPLFQYLNPANIFFMAKMSDRKGYEEGTANAQMSFEVFYKPIKKISLYSQFLLDDMDFTKSLRAVYPDRIGLLSKVIISDPIKSSQLHLTYTRISNWTYNSFYTWANYTYYGKSLGYPKNGDENLTFGFDYFGKPPFILSVIVKAERERKQDLFTHFTGVKSEFPIGISQNFVDFGFEIYYFPNKNISSDLKLNYLLIENYENITGNNKNLFIAQLGLNLLLVKGFELKE